MVGDGLAPGARLDAAAVPLVAPLGADAVQLVTVGDGSRERRAARDSRAIANGLRVDVDVDVDGDHGVDDAEPRERGCRGIIDGLDPEDVRTLKHESVLSHPPTLGQATHSGLGAAGGLQPGRCGLDSLDDDLVLGAILCPQQVAACVSVELGRLGDDGVLRLPLGPLGHAQPR